MIRKTCIEMLEDCLLVDKKILVLSDLHIGYQEHISAKGALPNLQFKEIIEKLERIFLRLKKQKILIEEVIILGDLKHEFGGISDSEWSETIRFLDYLEDKIGKNGKVILIKGNHDNILGPIAKKKEVKLKEYYKLNEICFLHGHKEYKECKDSKIIIMGHLHPSISLRDKYKKEKFKCFLNGKWKNKLVYILPSFSPISFGYDVSCLKESDNKKGFIIVGNKSLRNFRVFIYNNKEDRILNFGKLNKLISERRK